MEARYETSREPFGAWLPKQAASSRWFAELATAAKRDPAFPKAGDPDAVRKHLIARGAEADVFEMLDDAELDWLAH